MPKLVAFDTETDLIRPGYLAPDLVCVTWQSPGEPAKILHHLDAEDRILHWLTGDYIIVGHNVAYDLAVLAERYPCARPLIFRAYEEDRVTDTMIRQQLLDNAAGVFQRKIKGKRQDYSLETTARRCAGMQLQKDAWRLSYGKFLNVPLTKWPDRAREIQAEAAQELARLEGLRVAKESKKEHDKRLQGLRDMLASPPEQCIRYPLEDARATLATFLAQEKHVSYLADQYRQARAAWALYLSSAWGLRTDEKGVDVLRRETLRELEEVEEELRHAGLVREDGSRDTKAAKARMIMICERNGWEIPRTDTHCDNELTLDERKAQNLKPICKAADGTPLDDGHDDCREHVCLDAESCDDSEDDILIAYARKTTLTKILSNDIEAIAKGVIYPVHPRYGFAGTGRSTCSNPNIQNQSTREGIREAFIARPGRVLIQCDYPQLELYTLAQCCISWLGESKLAEALNSGLDPHLWVAAIILATSYEDVLKNKDRPEVKKARQLAKPANFGFPGGMGIESFVAATRKSVLKHQGREAWQALGLTEARAEELKDQWFQAWPEMKRYFARVNALCKNGRATVETLFTQRWRGNATYCATCNNGFQALGADCAKNAAWLIARAEYAGTPSRHYSEAHPGKLSPLLNGRTVAFVHDEFVGEVDDNPQVHDAAFELAHLMVEGVNKYLPDVPIPVSKMEPTAMHRWSKKAKQKFDDNGRLVAWAA